VLPGSRGPERDAITGLIPRYGLADRIVIIGAIRHNEVISSPPQARCLLMASGEEGMPQRHSRSDDYGR
jgi:hypothetical protein